jgi:hypothetical protein
MRIFKLEKKSLKIKLYFISLILYGIIVTRILRNIFMKNGNSVISNLKQINNLMKGKGNFI